MLGAKSGASTEEEAGYYYASEWKAALLEIKAWILNAASQQNLQKYKYQRESLKNVSFKSKHQKKLDSCTLQESALILMHPVVFKKKKKGAWQIKMCRVLQNCHSFAQGLKKQNKTEQ